VLRGGNLRHNSADLLAQVNEVNPDHGKLMNEPLVARGTHAADERRGAVEQDDDLVTVAGLC
jgi:hypothetical protein